MNSICVNTSLDLLWYFLYVRPSCKIINASLLYFSCSNFQKRNFWLLRIVVWCLYTFWRCSLWFFKSYGTVIPPWNGMLYKMYVPTSILLWSILFVKLHIIRNCGLSVYIHFDVFDLSLLSLMLSSQDTAL